VREETSLYFRLEMQFRFRSRSTVLLPLFLLGLMLAIVDAKPPKGPKIRDLADSVASNVITTKFSQMIQAAPDLVTLLSSRGPFTLFVPTDSAFSKLPPGTLETLLRPENKARLEDILLFHVVNGRRLTAKDMVPLKEVLSCLGTNLPLHTSKSGTQFVNKAKITHADIKCSNGNICQVDALLMPPESALPPIAAPESAAPAPDAATNAAPVETNTGAVIPVAPIAAPETPAR
jgi:uncharacterized surface protein with fasciclin (FAS1) repeats